ncbi:HD-GYP domain, c-di-GMP phosphodiesterase class II (or its inactivated variant) [Atopomonas hussainii]|uniref:HD-GYP domain, c-di-GMP phosphodiesterase class II (Or its inactivated variant) n=1 Tax=Atopomonas hussainii TaxID=1429083 RepID=A0A1H7RL73_9GAMM|nr:HD domain-containing phosphohydrolase [Atopomonas hussainii]SEL60885.1 HD-GYP domain, c-di-GMP phosphodiesterase class II (or its inactivated variant) [Atopomonas hussainii]
MPSRRIPLYIHIAYLFVGLLLGYALVSQGYQYWQTQRLLMQEAQSRYQLIANHAQAALDALYRPSRAAIDLLAHTPLVHANSLEARLSHVDALVAALHAQPQLSAAYVGWSNGDFFLLRPWADSPLMHKLYPEAPLHTRWVVQSRQPAQQAGGTFLYLDAELKELARHERSNYPFDPRSRRWYQQAQARGGLYSSNPYRFFTSDEAGITLALAHPEGHAVLGLDTTLSSLDALLSSYKPTPSSQVAVINATGEIVTWSENRTLPTQPDSGLPLLSQLNNEPLVQAQQLIADQQAISVKHGRWQAQDWQLARVALLADAGDMPLYLLLASPHDELLAAAKVLRHESMLISMLLIVPGIALALLFARWAARPLKTLTREAEKIERFNFDEPLTVDSNIAEVADLARAMGKMKATIHRFLDLSLALSAETDFQRLLAQLIKDMQEVTNADAALIYLQDSAEAPWQLACLRHHGQMLATEHSAPIALDAQHHPLLQALHFAKPVRLSGAQASQHFSALPTPTNDLSLWALPLRNRKGDTLGILALLVDEAQNPLSRELMAFAQTLSTTAAVALNTQRLLDEQKALLEAFIQLLAGAIDAKSPYTGGHCQRVPELAKALAQAACAEQNGPFKDFSLSAEQWETLHIAAWLHDCGKVTTPEYVVDKATKLETLYDRIHEVRMRFEVLKRDAHIAYWQARAEGEPNDSAQLKAQLQEQLAQLDDDFAFVARCNVGGEFMADSDLARLERIAGQTWLRTLSDRLGIGHEELQRKQAHPEPPLPTLEPLLADKPEHSIERRAQDVITANNPWGFSLQTPALLYNRGELYNLSVRRGTLSEEERFKINEHIIQTIIMLERLPFPRHLREVPEIAGGHHEKMDGQGYPRGLTQAQMSIPARMMAIADIFEALTAIDRPYKAGKPLSVAMRIMAKMRDEQHIDAELFALFVRSGVYRRYAEQYMPAALIDAVDEAALLS